MKNFLKNMSDRDVKILIYAVFAITTVFFASTLSLPYVLDETGTVANTAFMAGDDWSFCVQTMGGFYYKYAFSALYYPIYMAFRSNPVYMYKAMISFNMLIMSFIPVISYHICRKHLKIESKIQALLISVPAVGISSIWLYAMYARCDAMLIFLPWPILLVILELSSTTSKTVRNTLSAVLAFVTVYAYMTHTRGVVLIIAAFMTVVLISAVYKHKTVNYFIYVPVSGVLMVIDKFLAAFFKNGVYGIYGTRHGSIDVIDMETLGKLFTLKGMLIELKLVAGWLFNLFASTMGLVIIGFFAALIILFINLKKANRGKNIGETILSLFSALCLMGTFALGALFFFPSAYELFTGVELKRADRIVFGRYTVGAVGLIVLIALYSLVIKKGIIIKWKAKVLAVVSYVLVFVYFIKKVSPVLATVPKTNTRYFISLTKFFNVEDGITTGTYPQMTEAFTKAGFLSLGLLLVILILTSINKIQVIYSATVLIFILSALNYRYVASEVRGGRDELVYERTHNIIDYIAEIDEKTNVSEKYPDICYHKSAYLVKTYQFGLPQFNIGTLKYLRDDKKQKEFIVICDKASVNIAIEDANDIYGDNDKFYTFNTFKNIVGVPDTIIVKGKNLAKFLKSKGYALSEYKVQ